MQITRHVLGEVIEKELTTNGKLKNVTKENRKDYCDCYMNYFLKTSIQEQFKAFKEGFMRVCEGKVLVRIYTYRVLARKIVKRGDGFEIRVYLWF